MGLQFRTAKRWITKRIIPDYTNQLDLFSEAPLGYGARALVRDRSSRSCQSLNGLPNPFGGDLSVRELLHWGYPMQAVPSLDQPLAVVANRVRKLLFG